jgi:hypothetical protein
MPPEPAITLATLTHDHCSALVGQMFRVQVAEDQELELTLAEAKKLASARPDQRAPFSLIFRPADPKLYLPQRMYPLTHPQLGTLEIFLVPIRPDGAGARFEAVFT